MRDFRSKANMKDFLNMREDVDFEKDHGIKMPLTRKVKKRIEAKKKSVKKIEKKTDSKKKTKEKKK